jgi:hypothetical protein
VFTVEKLVSKFLTFKRDRVDSGELSARSFGKYYDSCGRVLDAFFWNRRVTDLKPDGLDKVSGHAFQGRFGPSSSAVEHGRKFPSLRGIAAATSTGRLRSACWPTSRPGRLIAS